jgi:hypothetical protein
MRSAWCPRTRTRGYGSMRLLNKQCNTWVTCCRCTRARLTKDSSWRSRNNAQVRTARVSGTTAGAEILGISFLVRVREACATGDAMIQMDDQPLGGLFRCALANLSRMWSRDTLTSFRAGLAPITRATRSRSRPDLERALTVPLPARFRRSPSFFSQAWDALPRTSRSSRGCRARG